MIEGRPATSSPTSSGGHVEAAPMASPFTFPERCPACGGVAFRPEGEGSWRCMNTACPAQLKDVSHFGSRRAMDIEHLGDAAVDSLLGPRPREGLRRSLSPDRVRSCVELERLAENRRRTWRPPSRAPRVGAARPAPQRARHPHGRRAGSPLAGHRFGASTPGRRLRGRRWPRPTASAPRSRLGARVLRRRDQPARPRRPRPPGVDLTEQGARVDGPRLLSGQTFVITGTLPSLTREAARELVNRAADG